MPQKQLWHSAEQQPFPVEIRHITSCHVALDHVLSFGSSQSAPLAPVLSGLHSPAKNPCSPESRGHRFHPKRGIPASAIHRAGLFFKRSRQITIHLDDASSRYIVSMSRNVTPSSPEESASISLPPQLNGVRLGRRKHPLRWPFFLSYILDILSILSYAPHFIDQVNSLEYS